MILTISTKIPTIVTRLKTAFTIAEKKKKLKKKRKQKKKE
jgi:hypothetical protein